VIRNPDFLTVYPFKVEGCPVAMAATGESESGKTLFGQTILGHFTGVLRFWPEEVAIKV